MGRTPLFWAAENGHEEVVRILLERRDIDIEAADELGRTALCVAAQNGHARVVRTLVEGSANLNTPDNMYGRTPLSWAAHIKN